MPVWALLNGLITIEGVALFHRVLAVTITVFTRCKIQHFQHFLSHDKG